MTLTLISLFVAVLRVFQVEASGHLQYTIDIPLEQLRAHADDIGLLARNMPGVVGISQRGPNTYFYRTRKSVPLASDLAIDFLIGKSNDGSATIYESLRADDPNYMRCVVRVSAAGDSRSTIDISLRLRLQRESGSDVHWMAPIVGEKFISERMSEDLVDMLAEFKTKSSEELYARFGRQVVKR